MSDPFEPLRDLGTRLPAGAASPADIRRRGDEVRRRRRAATGLAAAMAVAALAIPASVLLDSDRRATPTPVAPNLPQPTTATDSTPDPSTDPSTGPTTGPPTGRTETSPTVPTTIPDGFPLTEGWPDPAAAENPEQALSGPSPGLEDALFDYAACGTALPVPEPVGRLRAIYRSAEDTRSRQLLTFNDAQQAVAFLSDLVAFYRACPAEPGGPQSAAYRRVVVETGVGGQSYAVGAFPPADQQVGSTKVLHVVRLGSAVLLDTTEGEGGTGDIAALTEQRAEVMTAAATTPIANLCRFTTAGC